MQPIGIADRFLGAFLGKAIGDAVGSPIEGMGADMIYQFFGDCQSLMQPPEDRQLHYTDDTEMMIGVAEALCNDGRIVEEHLVERFVANLNPGRGYGPGAIRVLQVMSEGGNWKHLTETMFPGGSYGNGAAMRVLPLALATLGRPQEARQWTVAQAHITHHHPLSDAASLALVEMLQALVLGAGQARARIIADELVAMHRSFNFTPYRGRASAYVVDTVQTVLHHLVQHPFFEDALVATVNQGDDADTTGALVGMLAGARCGASGPNADGYNALECLDGVLLGLSRVVCLLCALSIQCR